MTIDFLEKLRTANVTRSQEWEETSLSEEVDLSEVSDRAAELIRSLKDRCEIMFRSTEFGGESGELQDAIKKWERTQRGVKGGQEDLTPIAEEISDAITLDRIADFFNLSLEEVTVDKFNKTSEKHGLSIKL